MDPKARAKVDAGISGVTFLAALLRGKDVKEAQAEARIAVAFAGPLVEEVAPHAEKLWAERERRAAEKERAAQAPRCGSHAGIVCVLARGHSTEANPWHQDEHGTMFQ